MNLIQIEKGKRIADSVREQVSQPYSVLVSWARASVPFGYSSGGELSCKRTDPAGYRWIPHLLSYRAVFVYGLFK